MALYSSALLMKLFNSDGKPKLLMWSWSLAFSCITIRICPLNSKRKVNLCKPDHEMQICNENKEKVTTHWWKVKGKTGWPEANEDQDRDFILTSSLLTIVNRLEGIM